MPSIHNDLLGMALTTKEKNYRNADVDDIGRIPHWARGLFDDGNNEDILPISSEEMRGIFKRFQYRKTSPAQRNFS